MSGLKFTFEDSEVAELLAEQESQYLESPNHWREELDYLFDVGVKNTGWPLPWDKTKDHFRLREGEVSVWAGVNGSFKSMITGQVALHFAQYQPVCIASLEMLPRATLQRACRQVYGQGGVPDKAFRHKFLDDLEGNLWIYDQTDSVGTDRMLAMIHYAALKLGCKLIIIDSLIKCGIGRDNYEAQARFMDQIAYAAKRHKIHIVVVHHIRKSDDDTKIPNKWDLRGAAEITDLVDSVVVVWADKEKQRKRDSGYVVSNEEPDQILRVVKQRHGDFEGDFALWFDQGSLQFREYYGADALTFDFA